MRIPEHLPAVRRRTAVLIACLAVAAQLAVAALVSSGDATGHAAPVGAGGAGVAGAQTAAAGGVGETAGGAPPAATPAPPRLVPAEPAEPADPVRFEAPAPPVPDPVEHPALAAQLDAIVAAAPPGSVVALAVSADDGAPVHERGGDVPVIPASTEKSVVAAAALHLLGPDFRYRTEVRSNAAPDADGVLGGSLVLVGSGDPMLSTAPYGAVLPARPHTPLARLADEVVAAGVRRVDGGVLGDPSVFTRERDDTRGYGSHISGLTVDGGRSMHVGPAGQIGSEVSPDPTARAADALHLLLVERGVEVRGPIGRAESPPRTSELVAAVDSPKLVHLLRYMVQESDNHLADAVFRTLGAAEGDGSTAAAARAVRDALAGLALRWDAIELADGSGLSRDNRLTPQFLADLDAAMWVGPHAAVWAGLMAVSGERGTLQRRMIGTPAHGRVLAKTGTLTGVRALSGAVVGPGGDRYHFALIGNDLPADGAWQLLQLQDRVAVALAEDLDRCAGRSGGNPGTHRCAA